MPFYKEGGGGGTLLDSLREGLENVEKITTQSKVEDVVKNTSPLAADFRKSEAEGETRNIRSSVVSNSKLNLRSERCHLMRGRNGRFAPQNDMVLNNPSRFTPHSSHRKSAFTMAEIIIVIAIVGFVCMALMSVIRTAMPDYITVMKRKCYQILEDKVTQMYYDDDLYVRGTKRGFGNLQNIEHNGKTYGGDTKFCELFASTMNKWGGTTCEENKMTFKTADNVYWYLPVTDFSKGYAVVKFDVNGSKKPNCEYDATTCPKPDTFRYYVLGNGKISEHEPKPEEFDYCIKTIITGSGSVLPSAEYCGLKNGTYELTSVPATGWSSPWTGNKKEVTILDSDEVVYLNFTKDPEPEPTTPTSPTVPTTPTEPTTPDEPKKMIGFEINLQRCPYYQNMNDHRKTLINPAVSGSFNSTKELGEWCCYSDVEVYANGKFMFSTKSILKQSEGIQTYLLNPRLNYVPSGVYLGGSTNMIHFSIPISIPGYYNPDLKENTVTVKVIPRKMFNADVTEKTCKVSFEYSNFSECKITTSFSAKKLANNNGWVNLDGTQYKITKYPANKEFYEGIQLRKINYELTDDPKYMKEGPELACSAIGGQPANKEQIINFINAVTPVEAIYESNAYSDGMFYGGTAMYYDDLSLFGITDYPSSGAFGYLRFNHIPSGSIPEFNTYANRDVHNVLCVK